MACKSWTRKFSKNLEVTSNYSCQKGDMKQIPYQRPTKLDSKVLDVVTQMT